MIRFFAAAVLLFSFFFSSCNSNEVGSSKDVNPESIFFDYQVRGEEGNDVVTVLLQYRFAGENGTTLTLDGSSSVKLDGQLITGDSSKMTGAYYEVQKPVAEFSGKHSIVFANIDKKEYKEEFNFQPMRLLTAIPENLQRGEDLVLELGGLQAEEYVRVLLTDTAYANEGIERTDTVKNGRLIITNTELEALADGPIQLELIKERETPIKNGTKEGGRLSVSYGLKREFVLKD
jgi:hypothetical protein